MITIDECPSHMRMMFRELASFASSIPPWRRGKCRRSRQHRQHRKIRPRAMLRTLARIESWPGVGT